MQLNYQLDRPVCAYRGVLSNGRSKRGGQLRASEREFANDREIVINLVPGFRRVIVRRETQNGHDTRSPKSCAYVGQLRRREQNYRYLFSEVESRR